MASSSRRLIDWEPFQHPKDQSPYQYHRKLGIITTDNIDDPHVEANVIRCWERVQAYFKMHNLTKFMDPWYDLIVSGGIPQAFISWQCKELYDFTSQSGFMTRNTRKTFWLQVAEFPCHHDSAPPGAYESLEVALRNERTVRVLYAQPDNRSFYEEYIRLERKRDRKEFRISERQTWCTAVLLAELEELKERRLI
ncbi:hypothetical protein BD626DRAFT_533869 [Schizophyllum amplum]|uniref:Uncharacterized protein n=1 Tax=Schizophyllum amplum TaxID=97359 RepID=A0A550CRH0_9AGAR|nr:hypothetical protein BD626DRAFT_533869 [Auriculariopsis ampla]